MLDNLTNVADSKDILIEEGSLCILNITEGDIKISFDKDNPEEVEHARKVIDDMLKRGYTILVQWGEGWRRAKTFIPTRDTYVVETTEKKEDGTTEVKKAEVPARKARAMAIAPTAGG